MKFVSILSLVCLSFVGCLPEVIVESEPIEPPAPVEDVVDYCEVGMYHRACRRPDGTIGLCTVPGLCALPCDDVAVCREIVDCHIPACEEETCAYYMAENGIKCTTGTCLNGACQ